MPKNQLCDQWRECCAIAKNIVKNGTPNHLLVNRIMQYPIEHFYRYGILVEAEMERRGYKCEKDKFEKWFDKSIITKNFDYINLFQGWHTHRYLKQCYYNLQEKYDCGGIPEKEWETVQSFIIRQKELLELLH